MSQPVCSGADGRVVDGGQSTVVDIEAAMPVGHQDELEMWVPDEQEYVEIPSPYRHAP